MVCLLRATHYSGVWGYSNKTHKKAPSSGDIKAHRQWIEDVGPPSSVLPSLMKIPELLLCAPERRVGCAPAGLLPQLCYQPCLQVAKHGSDRISPEQAGTIPEMSGHEEGKGAGRFMSYRTNTFCLTPGPITSSLCCLRL